MTAKLYCTRITCNETGTNLSWFTSRRAAQQYGAKFAREEGDGAGLETWEIREIDIPPKRSGLVAWLNLHFTTDNG